MKKMIIVFMITIGFVSCSTEDKTKIDDSDLIGKWNWMRTNGGIAFNIQETPSSSGNSFVLNLMKNNLFSIDKNGKEVSRGKYEIVMKKSIYSGEIERFIVYSDIEIKQLQHIVFSGIVEVYALNKIHISDNNFDGIGSEFLKIE